jgi:hypothetical protein
MELIPEPAWQLKEVWRGAMAQLVRPLRQLREFWATGLMGLVVMMPLGLPRALVSARPPEMPMLVSTLVAKFQPLPELVSRKFSAEHPVAAWIRI